MNEGKGKGAWEGQGGAAGDVYAAAETPCESRQGRGGGWCPPRRATSSWSSSSAVATAARGGRRERGMSSGEAQWEPCSSGVCVRGGGGGASRSVPLCREGGRGVGERKSARVSEGPSSRSSLVAHLGVDHHLQLLLLLLSSGASRGPRGCSGSLLEGSRALSEGSQRTCWKTRWRCGGCSPEGHGRRRSTTGGMETRREGADSSQGPWLLGAAGAPPYPGRGGCRASLSRVLCPVLGDPGLGGKRCCCLVAEMPQSRPAVSWMLLLLLLLRFRDWPGGSPGLPPSRVCVQGGLLLLLMMLLLLLPAAVRRGSRGGRARILQVRRGQGRGPCARCLIPASWCIGAAGRQRARRRRRVSPGRFDLVRLQRGVGRSQRTSALRALLRGPGDPRDLQRGVGERPWCYAAESSGAASARTDKGFALCAQLVWGEGRGGGGDSRGKEEVEA